MVSPELIIILQITSSTNLPPNLSHNMCYVCTESDQTFYPGSSISYICQEVNSQKSNPEITLEIINKDQISHGDQ